MTPWKNPFRFYGFQKLAYLLLAVPVVLLAAFVTAGSPPEDWLQWPAGARFAVAKLSIGLFAMAGLGWLMLLLRPVCRSSTKRRVIAGVVLFLLLGLPGMWALVGGVVGLTVNGGSHAFAVMAVIVRVAFLPVAIGVTLTKWPDLMAYLKAHPTLRRWTVSGTGRHSSWAGPVAIRRHITRIEDCRTPHGYFSDGVFVGRTNFEDTFARGEEVFLRGPSHLCTIAQTGGGKHICAASNYSMHRGSMVHITVKPEAADQFLAARIDQDQLPPHPRSASAGAYGVDPRGITKVTRWLPQSQAFLLDAAKQSVFPSNRHTLLSEIDPNSPNARVLALAIADGSFPDDGKTKDPWFREAPRNYLAAGILHALTFSEDRRRQNLPRIVERAMGIDRIAGENGPKVMEKLLHEMVRSAHPMQTAHEDLATCLRQLEDERLRIRDLATARVKQLRTELTEAERLVEVLSDSATAKAPRRRATSKAASAAPSVTKPIIEELVRRFVTDNPGITSEETWDLVSDQLRQDGYSRSGAKMVFNRVYSALSI